MIRPVDGTVRSELNLALTNSGITTGTQRHRRRRSRPLPSAGGRRREDASRFHVRCTQASHRPGVGIQVPTAVLNGELAANAPG